MHWREVYGFPEGGASLAHRTDTYVDGKFAHAVDPKDDYPVRDCRNARHRRVLEFLVPIVHLDKPTRVTIIIKNTIFGALEEDRPVDWGVIFRDLVQRLVARVGMQKPTPICPFLFHLYDNQGLLLEDEEVNYKTTKELARYRITSELDSRAESEDEQDNAPAASSEQIPGPVAQPPAQEEQSQRSNKRMKTTY